MKTKYFLTLILLSGFFIGCGNGNDKNRIEESGTIEATDVIVSAKTPGQVISLLVDEGSQVHQGDTLLIIDHESLDLQLIQAEASMEFAEAQLNLLRKGARTEDINAAKEQLKQAEINLNQAAADKERMIRLYETKSITKKQYEDAITRFEIVQAQFNASKENISKISNLARPEELQQMSANLKRSDASIELLRKSIRDSYITAPITGMVVKKFVEKGETVNPSSSLFKLSDLTRVDLVIYVSEEELGMVKIGQSVNVSVDAFKDKSFEGTVAYISPEAEFTPKNIQTKDERTKLVFAVKIKIQNPSFELKAGMPADAAINL